MSVKDLLKELTTFTSKKVEKTFVQLGVEKFSTLELEPIRRELKLSGDRQQILLSLPKTFFKTVTCDAMHGSKVNYVRDLLVYAQGMIKLSSVNEPILKEAAKLLMGVVQDFFRDRKQIILQLVAAEASQPRVTFGSCLCSATLVHQSQSVQCRSCGNHYHVVCLKLNKGKDSQFLCPDCVLLKLDPMNRVKQILCKPQMFRPTQHAPAKTMVFPIGKRESDVHVEVRCIRINGGLGAEEITWPDLGDLSINNFVMREFKPLAKNCATKKRKDEKFIAKEIKYEANNVVRLREGIPGPLNHDFQIQLGDLYIWGIYLVEALLPHQFVTRVKQSPYSYISEKQSREIIQLYMKTKSTVDVQMEQHSVSLLCVFDAKLIETPVRGTLCEHLNCFSLENMAQMMQKLVPRKWRCPICKSKCFEMVIDSYQQLAINHIRQLNANITELIFDLNGNIIDNTQLKECMAQNPTLELPTITETRNIQLESLKKELTRMNEKRLHQQQQLYQLQQSQQEKLKKQQRSLDNIDNIYQRRKIIQTAPASDPITID